MRTVYSLLMITFALCLPLRLRGQEQTPAAQSPSAAEPIPDAHGVYSMGRGVVHPELISPVQPEYSEAARKKRVSGSCVVALVVDAEGNVTDVHVTRSAAEGQPPKLQAAAATLDQKAMEAVQQYRFKPATLRGKAVPFALHVDVTFQMR